MPTFSYQLISTVIIPPATLRQVSMERNDTRWRQSVDRFLLKASVVSRWARCLCCAAWAEHLNIRSRLAASSSRNLSDNFARIEINLNSYKFNLQSGAMRMQIRRAERTFRIVSGEGNESLVLSSHRGISLYLVTNSNVNRSPDVIDRFVLLSTRLNLHILCNRKSRSLKISDLDIHSVAYSDWRKKTWKIAFLWFTKCQDMQFTYV